MSKSDTKQNPEFLDYVYQLNEGNSLEEALRLSLEEIDKIDVDQLKRIGLKTYEKDKWTLHQIIQHLIDWERIWGFRAIIFARSEGSTPEAHDQEIMARNSNANEIPLEVLIEELRIVRESSILLFKSFNEDILKTNCKFFEYEMPLFSIGLTIAAHQIHHLNVIRERYLPLYK
ncbi:DinB family protein [Flammeovirga sp. MY04]|uniref:DinB family protein n=1 Tax=Flammeovirga sp. MY04 TaxID=1191459 RepID=UPI0008061967|nr:DinB family protein [Flammeovirga sp. MY04]ANQ49479.1 DinB family protein [Flammeovirga sp. MY04]